MITKEWKIDRLLERYPQALEVLVAASPHFKKLRNRLLRKALAPRVTIEQAAAIGGVELNGLLRKLNDAAGVQADPVLPANGPEDQGLQEEARRINEVILESLRGTREVVLDVRPILEGGTDPLKTILKAARELGEGEVLHLVNSFEPVPLYSVLGERGFTHFSKLMDGVWHIYFVRQSGAGGEAGKAQAPSLPSESGEPEIVELDVRGLPPPEPMMKILEALPTIGDHTLLLVHHHREPMMLYEKLEQRGFTATTSQVSEHYYKVLIRKKRP